MQLTFKYQALGSAPKHFTRIRLTRDARGARKFVREGEYQFLEIGAGKPEEMSLRKFILLCRAIVRAAREFKLKKMAIQFDQTPELFKNLQHIVPEEISSLAAQNFEMANYEFTAFKTKPKEGWNDVEEIALCGKNGAAVESTAKKGQIIGREINACRTLSNTPGGSLTPKGLAQAAKKAAAGLKVSVFVLGPREMKRLGMNAVLGMAQGSAEEPQFIILKYQGTTAKQKPVVLIGKGVTFDTGGLNAKPGDSMLEMQMDMSGGAAAIHAVIAAAKLKLKANVIGLVPAVENMSGSRAVKPGDIIKSLSGKTIEVLNTDAEGRVILSDAITYAKRFNPQAVVEASTLTGAALIALGLQASALMATNETLQNELAALGEQSGDYVWPFPLWEEYEPMVKGNFADVCNIPAQGNSRWGGVIGGGMFLREFAKDLPCPFAHLDIAPRMTSAPDDQLARGAAGAPVGLFLKFIESRGARS